mmetsp:Transcript_2398/g.2894  ORF Transcript_2398/g.2894 Transcript_2398/m.2894 type:complete len:158 (-) Transcript_2398:178-651(-)|eukprot:CAMPEP_0194139820 /NCGR_PEP_ID=MMETSP0152-20130528/9417_1 /TAXON_ID=1049557 /ORGANISM="Thalassiothrix antarctica, Strain L6-D1" /LENGTH=157 /DNA_ID=CAMNT_0038837783 /DNA_START=56 /DNA_END=529 /DNA_ORIENTATION=-
MGALENFLDVLCGPALYGIVFMYAPFMSFRALNTPRGDDEKQWLTFWVVFSAFQAAETLMEVSRISTLVPYYLQMKFLFTIFLLSGGASKIYDTALAPFFLSIESKISEEDLKLMEEDQVAFIKKYGARTFEKATEKIGDLKGKAGEKIEELKKKET